jgi:hypothetical protein
VLPIVRETPVLAGVCGTDPFRLMPVFLAELKRIGFSGVQNFPTVGLIDGMFRTGLEETGMGYDLVPLDEGKANEAYKAFAAEQSGFVAPTGMRLPANNRPWEYNGLPAATATQLCAGLGVDAVVVATENWKVRGGGVGPSRGPDRVSFGQLFCQRLPPVHGPGLVVAVEGKLRVEPLQD